MIRRLLLTSILIFLCTHLFSQILINEFLSSNIRGLTDEDHEYNDWIELYNNSDNQVNLEGYHLSDDAIDADKWTFPAMLLPPRSYLLVFASGKDRTELPLSYRTIITKGEEWHYLVQSSEPGSLWKNISFDDSGWKKGSSGFGYGDNDDATVLNKTISVFIRKEFVITNVDDFWSVSKYLVIVIE